MKPVTSSHTNLTCNMMADAMDGSYIAGPSVHSHGCCKIVNACKTFSVIHFYVERNKVGLFILQPCTMDFLHHYQ